ncbi:hypothetical protein [Leyella stercorea]|uniref:hypothetical protein n=1 Tax=Leyella stercorea TaxID=363265 RepID=UPI00242C1FBF|nr:hypothetical protein [Leyella stercorea]
MVEGRGAIIQRKTSRSIICVDRCGCLRRPMRMSAPTDADICVDRCGHPRRPMRTSAPTDADVCTDRCVWHNYPL